MATARIIAFYGKGELEGKIADVREAPMRLLKKGGYNAYFTHTLQSMIDEYGCVTVEKLKEKKGE